MEHTQRNRSLFFAFCLLSIAAALALFVSASAVRADQFNDLYYVDTGGVPDLTEEGKYTGIGPSGGGAGSDGAVIGGGFSADDAETEIVSGGADGDPTSGSGAASEIDVLTVLLGAGAIEGESFGTGSPGGVAADKGGAAGGGVSIYGAKARAAIRGDSDVEAVLRYWKSRSAKRGQTAARLNPFERYAMIAAQLAGEDEQLESASFFGGRFEIVYRSRGALFWFIPMSFPVRLMVVPLDASADVTVRLPWYRFFVNEYFTPDSLKAEIESMLREKLAGMESDEDSQALLFEAVAQFLRQKARTIRDSVFLT